MRNTRQKNISSNGSRHQPVAVDAPAESPDRLPVMKTYKIFIGGKFPRSESGRFYPVTHPRSGKLLANACLCSRKDFRDAVVAAEAAQKGWAGRTAYNRGQILYRIAEMLEGRSAQFVAEMIEQGLEPRQAKMEVATSIDRLVYYAGWADKYQQVFSSVNPVAASYFNFTILEPMGIVAAIAPPRSPLAGLVSVLIPAITGGNAVIALAGRIYPLTAITFAEVLATSDLPGGVVNLLTGDAAELADPMASHMGVHAVLYAGDNAPELLTIRTRAALNIKRVIVPEVSDWLTNDAQSPYLILDTQESKTTWHPIGT
jgi:acyl-CoA reductase-like NAD-dependent aldehyde dehydrogenase